jgi:chromosome segregation protein
VDDADLVRYTEAVLEEEREQLRRSIQRLKIKLEEVGGIDTAVLEEYNEVAERDKFLDRELIDLRESNESLRVLIKELDMHLERDFEKGITEINNEFAQLFQTMFGGGNAALKITKVPKRRQEEGEDENEANKGHMDTPEAGIEISVDLPRKRIKNLDMLSGGERALTSIALLFAMSIVNPPPFLVLDETDAALDEANSQRYGAMLASLSEKTQLIVITHNRRTMKEAGVLYGVTMGADGISKILSVKFDTVSS